MLCAQQGKDGLGLGTFSRKLGGTGMNWDELGCCSLTPTMGAVTKFKDVEQPAVLVAVAGGGGQWRYPSRERSWVIPGDAGQIHYGRMGFSFPRDRQAGRQTMPALQAAPGGTHHRTLLRTKT